MQIAPFQLERFFAQHEFNVQHVLSASDCESLSLPELLELADREGQQLWAKLGLGYTKSLGHPLLRREIAGLYQTISPADVLVAAPEEAIFLALNALLRPGDHLIVTFPAYQSLYEIAQSLGCQVTRWRLEPRKNGWELDLGFLRDQIQENTRLILVNFPHNPTGFVPPRELLEAIVQIARESNLPLFSDEMYWRLEHRPEARLPAVCDLYERGISLFGLSKSFGLPGLRIGWLATRDRETLARAAVLKDYTTICNSAPSEVLAIIALRASEVLFQRNLDIIQRNLNAARAFFVQHAHLFGWLEPHGGSIMFPRYTGAGSVEQFCQQVLEQESVLIIPGTLFEFPGHLRLGLGRKDTPAALEKVDSFIRQAF